MNVGNNVGPAVVVVVVVVAVDRKCGSSSLDKPTSEVSSAASEGDGHPEPKAQQGSGDPPQIA